MFDNWGGVNVSRITLAIREAQELTQRKSKTRDRGRHVALSWLFSVLVLSISVLVLAIVATIILTLRFRNAVELHRHPSKHRGISRQLGFEIETRFSF
jgi:hypothetical protein